MKLADAPTIVPEPSSPSGASESASASDIRTETDGEVTAPPEGVLPRGSIVGRYVVIDELGAGAMGRVYSAYDPQLDRRVALKLLRSHPAFVAQPERAQQRLLREAQALAKLAHPNVVAVHDVQTIAGGMVAVAMEYVEGHTLRAWAEERRRPWREVLPVFVAAGRGLAAAHRAGVVHRDFKPDNVMLGHDGRTRVLDFGLARADLPATESETSTPVFAATASFSGMGSQNLETIGIAGTPAYMAPELFGGTSANARSDQFSFCVALYEALYHHRPFRGDSLAAISTAASIGEIAPPDRDAGVPGWVHRLVVRGLCPDPEQRHVDMDALVEALARDPSVARRRAAVAVALSVAVVLGGVSLASALRTPDPCSDTDDPIAAAWNDARRTEVQHALAATGAAWHADLFEHAARRLDEQSVALTEMTRENCVATLVRGEQSEQLQDARTGCLANRKRELAAVVDRLAAADDAVVQRGPQLLGLLGPVDACADIDAMLAAVRPPEDPVVRARVEVLRAELAKAETLNRSGKYEDAIGVVQPVLVEAGTLEYPPLIAEAQYQLGELQDETGDWAAAEATLAEASWLAEKCHHDEIAARAATEVVYVIGSHLMRFDDSYLWARHAEAATERARDPVLAAKLLANRGLVLSSAGRYAEAETLMREALAARERLLEPNHPDVMASLANIASVVEDLGREEEAADLYRQVLTRYEESLGPDHPTVGIALNNLSMSESGIGRPKEALEHARRAEQIFRAGLPPDHPYLASALTNSIVALWILDEYTEARRLADERLAMMQRRLGTEHPEVGEAHASVGGLAYEMEDFDVAREHMTAAVKILEHALGPEHPEIVVALNNLATAERDSGDVQSALEKHERALAILEKAGLQETDDMALVLRGLSLDQLKLGRTREGLATAELALAKFRSRPASQDQVARTHLEIARAHLTLGEREAALGSAREGQRICAGEVAAPICADIDAWLADHGASKRP